MYETPNVTRPVPMRRRFGPVYESCASLATGAGAAVAVVVFDSTTVVSAFDEVDHVLPTSAEAAIAPRTARERILRVMTSLLQNKGLQRAPAIGTRQLQRGC